VTLDAAKDLTMITKHAKTLPVKMQKELIRISELAPVAPPPDEYLIEVYDLICDWKESDEWKNIRKVIKQYRIKHLPKQTKKSQFGTIIEITASGVSPSTKSKYVTILQHARRRDLTKDELRKQIKKHGINDFVANIRKKKKVKKKKWKSKKGGKSVSSRARK
jgi:hypothetical protein